MPLTGYRGEIRSSSAPILLASGEKLLVLWNRLASVVDGRTLTVLAAPIPDARAFTVSADGGQAAFLASNKVIAVRSHQQLRITAHSTTSARSHHPTSNSRRTERLLVVIGDASGAEASRPLALVQHHALEGAEGQRRQ